MDLRYWRALTTCGATLVVLLFCGCDLSSSPPAPTPTQVPPTPKWATNWRTGFVDCGMSETAVRINLSCWQGIVQGDYVSVMAGKYAYDCTRDGCGEVGWYDVEAWKPDGTKIDYVAGRYMSGFGPLHIQSVSGSIITFVRDGGDTFTVDIIPFLEEPPTPTPAPPVTRAFATATSTPLLALPSPTPSLAGYFTKCDDEMTAGSAGNVYLNCWSGAINGRPMYIWAGYARHVHDKKAEKAICGRYGEGETSYYHMYVVSLDGHDTNDKQDGFGCGHLSIKTVSGTVITFQMDDFQQNNSYTVNVDFAPLLQDPTPTPLPLHTATNIPTTMPTPTRTEIPTETPGSPTPTPTLELGWGVGCGMPYNSRDIIQSSCWRGKIGGQIINVTAGREGYNWDAGPGDPDYARGPERGALWVAVYSDTLGTFTEEVYDSPWKVGEVGLVSVKDTIVTLVPVVEQAPHVTFVFDLATRKWLAPTGPQMQQYKFEQVTCKNRYNPYGEPDFNDCWVGVGGGDVQSVRTLASDFIHDPAQGVIALTGDIFFYGLENSHIYRTPLKVGPVHITSVHGALFTLASSDGKTQFVFDVATRRWVPPRGNPQPTLKSGWVDWRSGWAECYAFSGTLEPQFYSCWQGTVKGTTLRINAGRDSGLARIYPPGETPIPTKVADSGCCFGLLTVANVGSNGIPGQPDTYSTSEKVGPLYIVAIEGTTVTLASYDPRLRNLTLTFDIATRKWVNP